jgi:outer membrane protein OmpA-like peptidoglycan-associated protein
MKKYPETKAVLNGYTDNKGGDDFNKRLALRRSLKIKEIMSLYGVAEDRISLVSKGIDELISAEGDVSALALARRVVIVIE